ncbi:MAG: hypothetical protein ABEJ31_02995 [Haloarculaceae archaeon]
MTVEQEAPAKAAETALAAAAFDALPTQIAVVDGQGEILRTNAAWERFGTENGLADPSSVGHNYLAVCDESGDADATSVADGLRTVLAGERDEYTHEYPCHDPEGAQR